MTEGLHNAEVVLIMVKIPADVRETVEQQRVLPIATADMTGKPNVVFVGVWKILDDETIMIVDNYLYKTKKNIEENPRLAFVVYDREKKKSFQLKCSVNIETSGKRFEEARTMAESKKLPGNAAVILTVKEIYDANPGSNAGKRIL
jgi:predicted pyridoxine 5'-phosphate oxidase superfamily flavin-nucleotide-binding protein